jgi:hypothetical protein
VATSRPVSDRASASFAGGLYGGDLVASVRRAQLELRADGEADWSAFRVWVP